MDLPIGYYVYRLGGSGYTGTDLLSDSYKYSDAAIMKRNNSSIIVALYSESPAVPMAINSYNGNSWSGWQTYVRNSDIDNIAFIKRGIISNNTIKDEKFFKTLKPGMYQVSTNDETYLPSRWGTLVHFRGENNYGTMFMIDVDGIMYTRPYSLVNDSWYTNWKRYG